VSGGSGTLGSITGTAAVGSPLTSATVTAYDNSGNACATAQTDASGNFNINLGQCSALPLLFTATDNGALLASVDSAGLTNVNINPLTTALVAAVLENNETSPQIKASIATQLTSNVAAEIGALAQQVTNQLGSLFPPTAYGVDWQNYSLVSGLMQAGSSQGLDGVLDNLGVQNNAGSIDLVNSTTGSGIELPVSPSGQVGTVTPIQSLSSPNYIDFNWASQYPHLLSTQDPATGPVFTSWGGSVFSASGGNNAALNYNWAVPSAVPQSLATPGIPFYNGVTFGNNPVNPDMPVVAMFCQNVNNASTPGGIPFGTITPPATSYPDYLKDTDVFVSANAKVLTVASQLAGETFTSYTENCEAGGSYPPVTAGNTLSFDASGNGTETAGNQVLTFTAAQMTAALNGQGLGAGNLKLAAFEFTPQGSTTPRTFLVEYGGITPHVGVWTP
jgi:uncharacterized protein YidB (DUF937 family)